MIYSKSKQFIFCHVPKTGGTSIRNLVGKYRRPEESSLLFRFFRKAGFTNVYPFYDFYHHPHTTLSKAKFLLGNEVFSDIFTFAVVREPIDWLFSCYKFFMLGNSILKNSKIIVSSFESYIDAMISLKHLKPCQSFHLVDYSGSLLVDDIGQFGKIDEYCSRVVRRLSIENDRLHHLNSNPISSAFQPFDYLNNPTLLAKIHSEWALDFELWDLVITDPCDLRSLRLHTPVSPAVDLINYDPWAMFEWSN